MSDIAEHPGSPIASHRVDVYVASDPKTSTSKNALENILKSLT
jgi:hypothetical protein